MWPTRSYDEMISFASYAFNKSHAAAYSVVAMQTGWLKRYYPEPFMAAIMNSVFGNSAKIAAYIQYCRGRNIPILPPSVNASQWKFTVERLPDGRLGILFGLGAVKNVGAGAVDAIVAQRQKAPFKDIFDFCRRIDTEAVNKRVVESLIKAGAFDFDRRPPQPDDGRVRYGAGRRHLPAQEQRGRAAEPVRPGRGHGHGSPAAPHAPPAGASPPGAAGHGEGGHRASTSPATPWTSTGPCWRR